MRPKRIDQVVHVLAGRDAIGAHLIHTGEAIRRAGYESDIYVGEVHSELAHLARPLEELPPPSRDRWLLLHHSTGAAAVESVLRRDDPLIVDYHNVTPASLLAPWEPWLKEELELGVEQLHALARKALFGVAHSRFSETELRAAGCTRTSVVAPLVDLESFERKGDPAPRLGRIHERKESGSDWLFVGRVSPHKAQHDVVKAFYCYKRFFDPAARLHLVGSPLGHDYPRALWRFVARLGLEDSVSLEGMVSDDALGAYYRSADVFVCMSDHEGFCVPLIEAMQLRVPVVAYDSSAVGETVSDGGIVLETKEPMVVATAVHRVLCDVQLHEELQEAGHRRASMFSLPNGYRRWSSVLEEAVKVSDLPSGPLAGCR